MIKFIRENRKWLGYGFYCLILLILFLYLLFPKEMFNDYLKNRFAAINPDVLFSFKGLSPSFPPGIRISDGELALPENPDNPVFKAESISVRPKILSFFKSSPEYCFKCAAYYGNLSGCAVITEKNNGYHYNSSILLEDIRVNRESPLPGFIKERIEGYLNGSIKLEGDWTSPVDGSGSADLILANGLVKLAKPVLGIEEIDFNEFMLKLSFENRKLNISSAKLKGKELNGTAAGVVYLSTKIMESRLDMKGSIEPIKGTFNGISDLKGVMDFIKQSMKDGKLSFTIKGTFKNPLLNFI